MYYGEMTEGERKFLFLEGEKEGPVKFCMQRCQKTIIREAWPQEQKRTHWETLFQARWTTGETKRRMLQIAEYLLFYFSKPCKVWHRDLDQILGDSGL